MSRPPAVHLADLRAVCLGEIVSDLRRTYSRAFGPCEDPICDLYGHVHYDMSVTSHAEKKARKEARETITRKGLTPDLFWTLLLARVSARWLYASGTMEMFDELFPESAS